MASGYLQFYLQAFMHFSIVAIKLTQAFSINHWIIFYVDSLDSTLSPTLLVTYSASSFSYGANSDYFYPDTDIEDNNALLILSRVLQCINILFWALLFKTIAIRYLAINHYFKKYNAKIKQIQSYALWINILMGRRNIFSQNALEFLHSISHFNYARYSNKNATKNTEFEFHLSALEDDDDLDYS